VALLPKPGHAYHWISSSLRHQGHSRAIVKKFGRLDIMVNCADLLVDPLLELSLEPGTSLRGQHRGAFFCSKPPPPRWCLTNPAGSSRSPRPRQGGGAPFATYGASKAVPRQPEPNRCHRVGAHGITVNTIAPGAMTAHGRRAGSGSRPPDGTEYRELVSSRPRVAHGRRVESREVAQAAIWLASEDAAYVTGERFNFTGTGTTMSPPRSRR